MTEEQTKKLNEIRDGLALWYIKGLSHFNNIKKVETDDVFRDGFDAAVKHLEPLIIALEYYSPTAGGEPKSFTITHDGGLTAKSALRKVFGE